MRAVRAEAPRGARAGWAAAARPMMSVGRGGVTRGCGRSWEWRGVVQAGFVEEGGETGPEVREQVIGVCQAGLRRQELGKLFGEGAERETEEGGIKVLERRVEERGGFGEEAGHILRREGGVVLRGGRRGGEREEGAGRAGGQAPEAAGPLR